MFLLVGFFNAEDFLVRTNPPHVNQRIDYVYLSRMSPDGYAGWKQAYTWAQTILTTNQQKSFLNKDDRREVAYAGMIINRTLINHFYLTEKYGSQGEYLSFYQTVLTTTFAKQQFIATQIANKLKIQRETQLAASPSAQLEINYQNLQNSMQKVAEALSITQQSAQVFKLPIDLSISSYYISRLSVFPQCDMYQQAESLTLGNDKYYAVRECSGQYYQLYLHDTSIPPKKELLDRLFTWNTAELGTYNRLRQEIPLSEVLTLQDVYFNLRERILTQPETERSFDVDISFDTPFLE
jgi:hypothetical protein